MELTQDVAAGLARIALGHVMREYPNKPAHVMAGPEDARSPAALNPVFYGSFDWHSCVHSYWLLARVLRRFGGDAVAGEIASVFERQLTPEKIAGECACFARPSARGYERPYGWAWLLKLAGELRRLTAPRWAEALAPLAAVIEARFTEFLPIATFPVRTGSHGNTAFALRIAADGASPALLALLRETAERWYAADRDCPAWDEPGGDDFLSPALAEAECVRRLMPGRFPDWFDSFLPRLGERDPATLFRPVVPSDRSDGKIAHLDGLNLSRAWCFGALADALPRTDRRVAVLLAAAGEHRAAGMPHIQAHYMGEHWLATYVLLALDRGEQE